MFCVYTLILTSLHTFYFSSHCRYIFYTISIIAPIIFLSALSCLVFVLPPAAGEKMGTSITVLLANAVYLILVSQYLPENSMHLSVLALYLTLMLALCTASLITSTFILHVHHYPQGHPVGPKVTGLVKVMQAVTCYRLKAIALVGVQEKSHGADDGKTTLGDRDQGEHDIDGGSKCNQDMTNYDPKNSRGQPKEGRPRKAKTLIGLFQSLQKRIHIGKKKSGNYQLATFSDDDRLSVRRRRNSPRPIIRNITENSSIQSCDNISESQSTYSPDDDLANMNDRFTEQSLGEDQSDDITSQTNDSKRHDEGMMTWAIVASTMDWFFYLTFALCCFTITTLLLSIMVYKGLLHPLMEDTQLQH